MPTLPVAAAATPIGGTEYAQSLEYAEPAADVGPSTTLTPNAPAGAPATDGMQRVREWARTGQSIFAPSVATQEPPPVYMP